MNAILLPLVEYQLLLKGELQRDIPFYKKHLENYLGSSYSSETYDNLLDEVARYVERRMKELTC